MDTPNEKRNKEASEVVKTFIAEFHARFGIFPRVNYSFDPTKFRMTLKELEDTVNSLIKKDESISVPGATLRIKKRQRELVIYRQCTFKLALDMGYGPSPISRHFGWDHSTVLYSGRNVKNLVSTKDKKLISILSKIENELQERFGTNGTIQPDDKSTVNT